MGLHKVINIFKKLPRSNKPIPPIPPQVWRDPLYFFAFGLGSGAMPFAPGTFGTLMAIPFYLLLQNLSLLYYLIFLLLFIISSIYICHYVSHKTGTEDHPGMCIDEFVGFFVSMINIPATWYWIIIGFGLFRLFDIWKPWPISFLDKKIHGGIGMVLDDIVAGLFTMVILNSLLLILPYQ